MICPRCNGVLVRQITPNDEILTCLICSREYNIDMTPRRMTVKEMQQRYNIRWNEKQGRRSKYV